MSNTSDTVLAFLVGAAIGGAAGLLMAPNTGATTRKKLKKSVADLQSRGEGLYEEAEKVLEKKSEEIGRIAKNQVDAVKEALNEGKAAYLKELKSS